MKDKIKDYYRVLAGLLTALVICTGIFCYYGAQKEVTFCDEVYSYTIIDVHGVHIAVRDNKWYTAPEMDKRFSSAEGFHYRDVIEATGWDVHPPVYYLVFKTVAAMFPQSTSKWLGFGTNLLFFIPFLILMYAGLYQISKKVWLSLAFTVLYGILPGVQGCALLIRMYMLLALWLFLFFLQTWRLEERPEKKGTYLALGVTTFLGFMTQYYFSVYAVLFSVFWGIDRLRRKEWKQMTAYLGVMIGAVAASTVVFPKWITHIFFGDKGEASISTLNSWGAFGKEIRSAFSTIGEFVFPGYGAFYWLILIGITIFFVRISAPQMKKIKKIFLMHLAAQLLYYCVVAHVMPTVESRYFWSVILVQCVMLIFMLVYVLKSYALTEKKQVLAVAVGLTFLYTATASMRIELVPYNGIVYKEGRLTMEQYSEIPWLYYGERNWQMHCTAFDCLIPEHLMFITDLQTLVYDETMQNSRALVLYAQSEEAIGELAARLEEISGYQCKVEKLADRPYNYAYLMTPAD